MNIQDGTYQAKGKSLSITEAQSGAIMLNFTFQLDGVGLIPARQCFVQKDGTISEHCVKMLKECFGLTSGDPFELVDNPTMLEKEVDLVIGQEEYNGQSRSAVKYINPIGGGSGSGKIVDRAAFKQRFGSKLRALSGGSPVTQSKPSAPKPVAPPSRPQAGPTSTMDECWNEFCAANAAMDENTLNAAWDSLLTTIKPNHGNNLTPAQWGSVLESIKNNVPY